MDTEIPGAETRGDRPRAAAVWGLAVVFWTLFAALLAVHTYLSMLTHGHSFVRILLFEIVVCLFWALAAPAITLLVRRFSLVPFRWSSVFAHVLAAGA
jgi:hypothetical protein